MSRVNKILLLILIVIGFIIVNRSRNQKSEVFNKKTEINISTQPKNKLTSQKNEEGSVAVTVEPEVLEVGQNPKFKLEFNTHSVDLSFDVAKQSYLLDDKGNRLDRATWNGSPPGGHHRSGTLTFNNQLTETKYVKFVLINISQIAERKFEWDFFE